MPRSHVEIEVNEENLWFLERYLNVFDFFDMFPPDAISSDSERGNPIKFQTDLGFTIETDIDRAKMQLRNRSKVHGWTRFTTEHSIRAGDKIIIEKTADRDFSLILKRTAS